MPAFRQAEHRGSCWSHLFFLCRHRLQALTLRKLELVPPGPEPVVVFVGDPVGDVTSCMPSLSLSRFFDIVIAEALGPHADILRRQITQAKNQHRSERRTPTSPRYLPSVRSRAARRESRLRSRLHVMSCASFCRSGMILLRCCFFMRRRILDKPLSLRSPHADRLSGWLYYSMRMHYTVQVLLYVS